MKFSVFYSVNVSFVKKQIICRRYLQNKSDK